MTREFVRPEELAGLVADRFGTDRRVTALDRLTGGSRKGVYRLGLDDGTTTILYVWAAGENYWPPSPTVPDDPFTDASGAELSRTGAASPPAPHPGGGRRTWWWTGRSGISTRRRAGRAAGRDPGPGGRARPGAMKHHRGPRRPLTPDRRRATRRWLVTCANAGGRYWDRTSIQGSRATLDVTSGHPL